MYIDFDSRVTLLEDISLAAAQQDMDAKMNKLNFTKIVDIGIYSVYSNEPMLSKQICLNILVNAMFEAPVQCTPGSILSTDLTQNLKPAAVLENNGFSSLVSFGPGAVEIPAVDIYVK